MKCCKKCQKIIEKKEETYNGLCFSCYQDYLFEKINNFNSNDSYKVESPSEKTFKKIIEFLKNLFKK